MIKNIVGLIVEFNPFHTGHKKLINEAKKLFPESIIIAVMSGEFVQRGELSIFDKWSRAEAALFFGVDLILEIPPFYVLNNANIFAKKAIEILNKFNVTDIIFGSENKNENELIEIGNKIISKSNEIKLENKKIHSFPKSIEKQIGLKLLPNEILGTTYIMEANKLNININFHTIKRKNNDKYSSASKIRESILNNKKNEHSLMSNTNKRNIEDYSEIIIGKLRTSKINDPTLIYLKNKSFYLKKNSFNELIEISHNNSFTKSKLRREILKFILELKKQEYINVLGFNKNAKFLLKNKHIYFRHTKKNTDNYNVENFLSLKYDENINFRLSKKTIIK